MVLGPLKQTLNLVICYAAYVMFTEAFDVWHDNSDFICKLSVDDLGFWWGLAC